MNVDWEALKEITLFCLIVAVGTYIGIQYVMVVFAV